MAAAPCKSIWLFLAVVVLVNCLVPYALAHGGDGDDDSDSGGDEGHYNLRSKGLVVVKIWCLILVFVGTFLGGISPYFYRWNESFLLLGTQFAGGVFLGTALMHFLSDSTETFEDLTDKEYPFSFMLSTAGYLITMLGDCIIVWLYQRQMSDVNGDLELGGSSQNEIPGCHRASPRANAQVENRKANSNMGGGVHDNKIDAALIVTTSLGDSLLLILALCFHSVFEGIAIGVAKNKDDAWKALWTVSLHKIFAAIAMGIALLRMIPNRPLLSCVAYAFAFAISSPVGVAIGIIIDATTQGPVADWIYAISMGLACGIFVYVAINHLLVKGFTPHTPNPVDKPFYKFLAVLLGAGVIAVVMIWDT